MSLVTACCRSALRLKRGVIKVTMSKLGPRGGTRSDRAPTVCVSTQIQSDAHAGGLPGPSGGCIVASCLALTCLSVSRVTASTVASQAHLDVVVSCYEFRICLLLERRLGNSAFALSPSPSNTHSSKPPTCTAWPSTPTRASASSRLTARWCACTCTRACCGSPASATLASFSPTRRSRTAATSKLGRTASGPIGMVGAAPGRASKSQARVVVTVPCSFGASGTSRRAGQCPDPNPKPNTKAGQVALVRVC